MELLPKAGGVIGNFLAINLAGLAEDLEITLSLDWGLFRLDIWVGGVRVWERERACCALRAATLFIGRNRSTIRVAFSI